MLTSIATVVCAAAMALSLSVEAGSFFRPSEAPTVEGSVDSSPSEPSAKGSSEQADELADTVRLIERDGELVPAPD